MKTLILLGLMILPALCFSQVVDTAAVVQHVDSLIEVSRALTGAHEFVKALEVNGAAERLCLEKLGRETAAYGSICFNQGRVLYNQGNNQEAEKWFLDSKSIREKVLGKMHPDYAWSLNNLGVLYVDLGRYEVAESLHLEAKNIREKVLGKKHVVYGMSLNNLGNLYKEIGRYETAEPLYLESKSIWENALGKESSLYALSLNNIAILYSKTGRYEAALSLFLESKAIREKLLGKESADYGQSVENLAVMYFTVADYKAAERLFKEVVAIQEKISENGDPAYAQSLFNLANVYQVTKRYEAAKPLYVKAIAIQEKAFGKKSSAYAQSLNSLGSLYYQIDSFDTAEALFRKALAIQEAVLGKDKTEYGLTLENLAILYNNTGRDQAAESLFLQAIAIEEKRSGAPPLYLMNLADLYIEMGRYESAESLYLQANALDRKGIITSAQYLSERELADLIRAFNRDLDEFFSFAQTNPRPALLGGSYDNALLHKGFLLTTSQQLRHLAQADTTSAKQFEILLSYRRRLDKEYTKPVAEQQSVFEIEEKANALEKEIGHHIPDFEQALRQVTWQEVQSQLQPGEVSVEFIQYHFYSPQPADSVFYTALVLRPGDKAPVFVPLFEERAILPFLESVNGGNVVAIDALYAPGGQNLLYSLVWKPLEKLLQGASTVYCSPTGLLHRVNLGAIAASGGQRFSDLHQFVLLGSTRQLVVPNVVKAAGNSAYVAGGIRYKRDGSGVTATSADAETRGLTTEDELPFEVDSTTRSGTWKYLPNSAIEALEIGKILKEQKFVVQLDTGYAATEEAFKHLGSDQPSPRTILLATHGFFFPEPQSATQGSKKTSERPEPIFITSNDPLIRSGLLFAGAQQTWTTGKGQPDREDGILTAYEISRMNLSATELVVLSACETGLGDIVGNEGIYGLQRAFKIAGAKYLIMSLWKVNDQSTSVFMTEFYRQWLQQGLKIPAAFQAAQKIMRAKYQDSPYHWAGFVLIE